MPNFVPSYFGFCLSNGCQGPNAKLLSRASNKRAPACSTRLVRTNVIMDISKAARAFCASLKDDLTVDYEREMERLQAGADTLKEQYEQNIEGLERGLEEDPLALLTRLIGPRKRSRSPSDAEGAENENGKQSGGYPRENEEDQEVEDRSKRKLEPASSKDSDDIVYLETRSKPTAVEPSTRPIPPDTTAAIQSPPQQTPTTAPNLSPELQFCAQLLGGLRHPTLNTCNQPFLHSVDGIEYPDYYIKIRNPMDLQTMSNKVETKKYRNAEEFRLDFYLMIQNCNEYNPVGHPVRDCGIRLRRHFEEQWNGKDRWVRTVQKGVAGGEGTPADENQQQQQEQQRRRGVGLDPLLYLNMRRTGDPALDRRSQEILEQHVEQARGGQQRGPEKKRQRNETNFPVN